MHLDMEMDSPALGCLYMACLPGDDVCMGRLPLRKYPSSAASIKRKVATFTYSPRTPNIVGPYGATVYTVYPPVLAPTTYIPLT